MTLLITACSQKDEVQEEDVKGVWEGAIQVPEQPLPIVITFAKEKDSISIPVQGLMDYPLSSVELDGDEIYIVMDLQGQKITFDGTVKSEKISGSFTQSGQSFPFELMKTEVEIEAGEAVEVKVADGTLAGLALIPDGEGPFPVMVIHAGSGPTDKNGNSLMMNGKNNSLKMIAEQLAENQIASIRYDKRGVGENTALGGKEEDLRFEDYIDDAASWLNWAKEDARFSKVGVIGHSEGALIGMIAAQQTDADLYISLAGPGRPFDDLLLEQLEDALSAELLKEAKDIIDELKADNEVANVSEELQAVFRLSVQPYLKSIMAYHPTEEIQQLKAQTFIVNGNHDLQVSVKDAELLQDAKPEAALLIVEEMNHVLKDAPQEEEENLATYTNPELPLAEGLMEGILKFLSE